MHASALSDLRRRWAAAARAQERTQFVATPKAGWMPVMEYSDAAGDDADDADAGLLQWLEHLRKDGCCLLKNAPLEMEVVTNLAHLIAYPQPTM